MRSSFGGCTALVAVLLGMPVLAPAQTLQTATYAPEQARAGAEQYARQCAPCHGLSLEGGEAGPALRGQQFLGKWGNRPYAELYEQTRRTMPVTQPGGLTATQYAQLLAFVMESNGLKAGAAAPALAARPMLPDGPPVIGASGIANIWLNLGHGGSGWALACGSARLVADQIAQRPSALDLGPFSIRRYAS